MKLFANITWDHFITYNNSHGESLSLFVSHFAFFQVKMAAPLASPSRSVEKRLLVYNTLNRFLSAFIDHSLGELDYLVRDKLSLEHILNMELKDQPPPDKAIFYNDNGRSFNSVLLYGHEWTLMLFDLLMFAFVDLLILFSLESSPILLQRF